MTKKLASLALALVMCLSLCVPVLATEQQIGYSDSCMLERGYMLSSKILDNGHLLVSLSKDDTLLESTETDYENQTLITVSYSNTTRAASTQVITFESFMGNSALDQNNLSENPSTLAVRAYSHFADVSFRSQIGTDFFFTPTSQVFVRTNTPGDLVVQKVQVCSLGNSVTQVVSSFSVVLGVVFPELSMVKSFLIALGILIGGNAVSQSVDYADIESRRYGESLRATYNNRSVDYVEGARIVASGAASNGKYANQTFYDGMCSYNILSGNLAQGQQIFNSFFSGYGTCRSMTVTAV